MTGDRHERADALFEQAMRLMSSQGREEEAAQAAMAAASAFRELWQQTGSDEAKRKLARALGWQSIIAGELRKQPADALRYARESVSLYREVLDAARGDDAALDVLVQETALALDGAADYTGRAGNMDEREQFLLEARRCAERGKGPAALRALGIVVHHLAQHRMDVLMTPTAGRPAGDQQAREAWMTAEEAVDIRQRVCATSPPDGNLYFELADSSLLAGRFCRAFGERQRAAGYFSFAMDVLGPTRGPSSDALRRQLEQELATMRAADAVPVRRPMLPRDPVLTASEAEQVLQTLIAIIQEALTTGDSEKVCTPVTLLNAARLMLVQEYRYSIKTYSVLGMLHFIRSRRLAEASTDAEAALRFFSHVYPIEPGALPDDLRKHFAANGVQPEPLWEVLHTHGRALVEAYRRDGGDRLLDHCIAIYELSLEITPEPYPFRPAMEVNLGSALFAWSLRSNRREDLDASVAMLQRGTRRFPDSHPDGRGAWSTLAVALWNRFALTGDLADMDGVIAASRLALTPDGPADDGSRALWFTLGSALFRRFSVTRSTEALNEAIDAFRAVAEKSPRDHPMRSDFFSTLGDALAERHGISGDMADLEAALRAMETADADAPAGHPQRALLTHNLQVIRERHARFLRGEG